ncbi:hypothetical protein LPB86_02075 [Pedobacter sp. MC2016-14]|uniref:hypothetical protein n=1 Tax=Pedobacter sp. MC2016-14 TaxID=2897327 RepID=UPI001E318E91|nr:hypothetical protein [Pedobacter sp. MC2016-14]MCD0486998.1 hypothetical protein [Pedobacter sp. MC2016-14]
MKSIYRLLVLCLLPFPETAFTQEISRFNPDTLQTIQLDDAVNIQAQKLSVETFINAIMADTSFYSAFRSMKKYDFIAEHRIYTFDKKDKLAARLYRKIAHMALAPQKISYLVKQDSGKVYKKDGKYQSYTVELFNHIFMNAYQSDFGKSSPYPTEDSKSKTQDKNSGYKDKLKTLIFAPGRPVKGIPFIGSKTEIFTANMRQYYNYTFSNATYLDSIPVYHFKVALKPDLSSWTKDGLMIKELVTIFDKRNFEILGRYVDMKYGNMLFNFDVQMNIEMSYLNEVKLPAKITYQGNWNVPLKKKEKTSFLILHKNYR